jgi:hypothetical protein
MVGSASDSKTNRPRITAPSTIAWNTVVPALGLALILGAPLVPAIAIAGAALIAINVFLSPQPRRAQRRWSKSAHTVGHRASHGAPW